MKIKKIISLNFILLIILILSLTFINNKKTVYSETNNEANFTNLIVFLKFNDETEFLNDICGNDTTVKQVVENSYEKADYSVKDYYKRVSNGKVNIQNLYLFDETGGSLTLDHNRGYFCTKSTDNTEGYESYEYQLRMSELKQDWSKTINNAISNGNKITNIDQTKIYDYQELDKNKDGSIDSLTIIYKYSNKYSVSWSDCLWNYQTFYDGVTVNNGNKTIQSGQYLQITANFNYLYSDKNGLEFYSLKTMIHETGHIFGLKDLYRSETNSRVYYMSAMANAISPVPQYISAKEREALGWIENKNIKEITSEGTYTIYATLDELNDEIICYKLNLPNSKKCVYFEYRNFNTNLNKYDQQLKEVYNQAGNKISGLPLKSGLVCFLSDKDTKFPNNLYTTGSYWNYEVLGGTYSTKVDSALSKGDNLDITLNLNVEIIEITNNKLTFKIKGTDIESSHNHNITEVKEKSPTCEKEGNIKYYYCNLCNKYFKDESLNIEITLNETVLSKLNHNITEVKEKSSTCEKEGNIKYYYCNLCNKYFKDESLNIEITLNETIINALGHDLKELPAVPATCKNTGLTEGKKCSTCDKILVKQEEVSKVAHKESDWIIDVEPSQTCNGKKHKECLDCKEILKTEIIYYQGSSDNITSDETTISIGCKMKLLKEVCILLFLSVNIMLFRKKEF